MQTAAAPTARSRLCAVVVAFVTTDQLMMELAMAGMDSAVVCSADACTLFTTTPGTDEERTLRKREL